MYLRIILSGLFLFLALSLCAQERQLEEWTSQDSLRLRRLLEADGEPELNRDLLPRLEMEPWQERPKGSEEKSWLEFDTSLPSVLPLNRSVMTLRPYSARTPYNWDPIQEKKIEIDKNTWRSDPFYELTRLKIPTNWAKRPLDAGPRETLEQIEATGLRYRMTERVNNMTVGSWQPASGGTGGGMDLMKPFTREFWDFKGRKRRARTMEVLKSYGDSITVQERR